MTNGFRIKVALNPNSKIITFISLFLKKYFRYLYKYDETELRALLSLYLVFSPSKKKRHRIKRERALMATKKITEFRFIYTMYLISFAPSLSARIEGKISKYTQYTLWFYIPFSSVYLWNIICLFSR